MGLDTKASSLDAIVFDVGGVLYDWHPRHLYRKLIPDEEALERFLAEVVTLDWHFQHDAGRPAAETTAELRLRHPAQAELIDAYVPRWLETVPGPIPGSLELVNELSDAGVPLYAITNFSHEFWPRFRAVAPVFDRFRDIVVSGEERLVKPDPRLYDRALDRFGLRNQRALFVDDRADNVAGAEAAGLLGHRFVDAATLRSALRSHGFPV